jgi:hypothetical protein
MKRPLRYRKPDPADALFDSLVRNAINFLRKSVQELEKFPKYSVIHFCMALELFLKARLLREHWALVVSKVEKASLQSFQSGNFVSVTMDECLQRLTAIANESLLPHELECFRTVRDHRNKLVHFFHPDYQPPFDKSILAQIVSQQCKAWFYLHRLLTLKWVTQFAAYRRQIIGLQNLIQSNQHFLSSKFKALKPEIEAAKKKGAIFVACCACSFEAARVRSRRLPLIEENCLICGSQSRFLEIPCPKCRKTIRVVGGGCGECENCETAIDLDYQINNVSGKEDPKEEGSIARCSECENFEPSVVPLGDGEHLCLACITLHDQVEHCGWCGELITGDASETSVFGCFFCPGPDLKD